METTTDTTFSGRVWKFGDDIDTDLIIPGYAIFADRDGQIDACMSANRPGWSRQVEPGDVLLAGHNFGVGSGRPIGNVFRYLGLAGILAESFNGLGLRNCINVGLPVLPCLGILEAFEEGDVVEANWTDGHVVNVTKGTELTGQHLPDALQEIIAGGGVERMLRAQGYLSGEGQRMAHEKAL
jgi:3-isopropylmalate/(R)-2-methylmalate dehydratase small subunit